VTTLAAGALGTLAVMLGLRMGERQLIGKDSRFYVEWPLTSNPRRAAGRHNDENLAHIGRG